MQTIILLIPAFLDILENGTKHQDYILRDVSLFFISNIVHLPFVFIYYVFLRIVCDIIDNITYKMLKPKYKENWVQIQKLQIHESLKKIYDCLFHLHLRIIDRSGFYTKKKISLSQNEYSLQ